MKNLKLQYLIEKKNVFQYNVFIDMPLTLEYLSIFILWVIKLLTIQALSQGCRT